MLGSQTHAVQAAQAWARLCSTSFGGGIQKRLADCRWNLQSLWKMSKLRCQKRATMCGKPTCLNRGRHAPHLQKRRTGRQMTHVRPWLLGGKRIHAARVDQRRAGSPKLRTSSAGITCTANTTPRNCDREPLSESSHDQREGKPTTS